MKKIIITLSIIFVSSTIWGQTNTFPSSGNVGIGITNPDSDLQFRGTKFKIESPTGTAHTWIPYYNGEIYLTGNKDQSGDGTIHFRTFSLSESYQDRMVIKGNGFVGVGTTSPSQKLTVSGNLRIGRNEHNLYHLDIIPEAYQGGNVRYDFRISDHDDIQNQTVLSLDGKTGFVGIGTTDFSGNHKLRVEGSIGAREIKVEASGWSDFVFEDEYELPTLEEVEQHISENGHLPEIPSESEVTKNGISLGEMDSKLLQKIEELTLYMIDLNKQVQELRIENQELKEEISTLKSN